MTECACCCESLKCDAEALVVCAWQGEDGAELMPCAAAINEALGNPLGRMLEMGDFAGKSGETFVFYGNENITGAERICLVGLGKKDRATLASLSEALGSAAKKLAGCKVSSVGFAVKCLENVCEEDLVRTVATNAVIAFADMARVGKLEDGCRSTLEKIIWNGCSCLESAVAEGMAIGAACNKARFLADLPPNVCTPQFVAETVGKWCEGDSRLCVRVFDEAELRAKNCNGILSVAQGSDVKPLMIEVTYRPENASGKPVALVGKGITFDAGGISLKPARGMAEMKYDMCGAATVLASVLCAAELNLPVPVVAVTPLCENLPSGKALKPADVIVMSNGLSVEVTNTDAEGRLILADALHHAAGIDPAVTIDVATLTGACIGALGHTYSGLFSDDEELCCALLESGKKHCDEVWRMPLGSDYAKQLETNCADLGNVGTPGVGGASVAAEFLKRFAPEAPWAHLDIAGTANSSGAKKAATGRPVGLLVGYLGAVARK